MKDGTIIRAALMNQKPKLQWELYLINAVLFVTCARDWGRNWSDYVLAIWAALSTVWFSFRDLSRRREWKRAMDSYYELVRKGLIS